MDRKSVKKATKRQNPDVDGAGSSNKNARPDTDRQEPVEKAKTTRSGQAQPATAQDNGEASSSAAPVNGPVSQQAPGQAPSQFTVPKIPKHPGQAGSQVPASSPVLKAPRAGQAGNQEASAQVNGLEAPGQAPPQSPAPKTPGQADRGRTFARRASTQGARAPGNGQAGPSPKVPASQVPPPPASPAPKIPAHGQTGNGAQSQVRPAPSSAQAPSASVPASAPKDPAPPAPVQAPTSGQAGNQVSVKLVKIEEPGPVEEVEQAPASAPAPRQAGGQAPALPALPAPPAARGQAGVQAPDHAQAHGQAPRQAEVPAPPSPSHWIPATPPELLNAFWTSISSIEDPKETAGRKMVSEIAIPVLLAEQSKEENRKENLKNSVKILMMVGWLHSKKMSMTKEEPFLSLEGIVEAEEVKRMILNVSTWVQLAGKEQMMAEFRSYVNWNGFPRIRDQFKKIKEKILELVKLQTIRDQAAGKSDEEIFLEAVEVMKIILEDEMRDVYGWSEKVAYSKWMRGNHAFVQKIERGMIEDLAVEEEGFDIMATFFKKLDA